MILPDDSLWFFVGATRGDVFDCWEAHFVQASHGAATDGLMRDVDDYYLRHPYQVQSAYTPQIVYHTLQVCIHCSSRGPVFFGEVWRYDQLTQVPPLAGYLKHSEHTSSPLCMVQYMQWFAHRHDQIECVDTYI